MREWSTGFSWRASAAPMPRTSFRRSFSRPGTGSRRCGIRRRSAAGWPRSRRNRATDHHRRGNDYEELPAHLEARDATAARTEALVVLKIIRSLPEAYRETLVLRLVEGMTGPEIAERTGLTAASVRVNLHRGMKLLREKLDA